jgi:hypothetical protein
MSAAMPPGDNNSAIEIVTIVVYLLGGHTRSVDTEDIAIKANEMAPGRFVWRKYPQHIDLQAVRFALENAKRQHCGYLIGTGNEGWMLAKPGLEFAEENVDRFQTSDLSGQRLSESDRKWQRRERTRLVSSAAYSKFESGDSNRITQQEAASFFRLDEYVTGTAREKKVIRIVNAFGNDPQLGPAVKSLAELLTGEESNEL